MEIPVPGQVYRLLTSKTAKEDGMEPLTIESGQLTLDLGVVSDDENTLVFQVSVTLENEVALEIYARSQKSSRNAIFYKFNAQNLIEMKRLIIKAERLFQRAGVLQ